MVLVCREQPSLGLVTEILSTRRVVVQHKSPILALILRNLKVQSFLSQYLTNLRCPTFWKLCATRLKQKHYFQGVFYFIPGMLRFSKYLLSVFPFIHLPGFNWKVVTDLANFLYKGQHILNSTDDALTLKLVELFIGADQEILVCNLLDEVFSSVKHLLLVTKIFHNYRAMATDEVHNQVHLLPSRNFLDKAETEVDLKHYFKVCSILHLV